MRHLVLSLLAATGLAAADWAPAGSPATTDQWHGYTRHRFTIEGCKAWVVEPAQAAPGRPWSWTMMFPDAFVDRCAATGLLARGFHHVHIDLGNTFGSPAALAKADAFARHLEAKGLTSKVSLIGLSRGGLFIYRWAARNPDRVAVLYGDAPVCDIRSWPAGKVGTGTGSPKDWAELQRCYGFADEAAALAFRENPIDVLAPLAQRRIPVIHVVGDADTVVPPADNTLVLAERYRALGGTIEVIHRPGVGHHPHGLDDPKPVLDFISAHQAR